jgi:hypothetical protein
VGVGVGVGVDVGVGVLWGVRGLEALAGGAGGGRKRTIRGFLPEGPATPL